MNYRGHYPKRRQRGGFFKRIVLLIILAVILVLILSRGCSFDNVTGGPTTLVAPKVDPRVQQLADLLAKVEKLEIENAEMRGALEAKVGQVGQLQKQVKDLQKRVTERDMLLEETLNGPSYSTSPEETPKLEPAKEPAPAPKAEVQPKSDFSLSDKEIKAVRDTTFLASAAAIIGRLFKFIATRGAAGF